MTEIKTMSELNNIGYSNLFLFSLATFLLIIYFGYLCFSTELPSRNWRTLTNLIYFIGVILILAFTTFEVYNTKCNNSTRYNMIDIFMAAFMPFIFVFLFGILLLTTYPGWIRGFSNTFGLSVLSLLSYKTFLQTKILSTNNSQDQASYNKLYEDPIPLFNELEPDFDETGDGNWPSYERIKKMLKNLNINITDNETHINELKQKILFKDIMGYIIWYFILGCITILFSIIQALDVNCVRDPTESTEFREYTTKKFDEV